MTTPIDPGPGAPDTTTYNGITVPTWAAYNALDARISALETVTAANQLVINRLLLTLPPPPPPPPTGSTVPGAPTNVQATPGNGQATVTWRAPASTGGSPITGYTVTASPGGRTASVNATAGSATVTGLTNGTSYTFAVVATNGVGSSQASAASGAITPTSLVATKYIGSGDQHAFTGMRLTEHRTYYDMANVFGSPDQALTAIKADALAGRLSVVSLGRGKNATAWPTNIPTGVIDTYLPALNANPNIIIVPHHEPENDPDPGGFTGQVSGYRRFFSQMVAYLKPKVPATAKFAPCLMGWTATKGQPGWDAWIPDPSLWDVFGIDGYSTSAPLAATSIYGALAYAKSKGKPLFVMECGMGQSGGDAGQTQYVKDLLAWTKSDPMHWGFSYWNSGSTTKDTNNYRLLPNALAQFGQIVQDPVFNSSAVKPI